MPNLPIKFSDLDVKIMKPAPSLGQHNEEVLADLLGYAKKKIDKLKQEGFTLKKINASSLSSESFILVF